MKTEIKKLVIKPEVAEDVIEIDADKLLAVTESNKNGYLFPRLGGNFAGASFYLPSDYNWYLGKDECDETVLVVTKK